MSNPARSRRWIVWLSILVMFLAVWAGGLLWHAPLSQWVVSPEDVEAELARRAAAGDPVRAEELEWAPAVPGTPWREVLRDDGPGLDLLEDRDALREEIVPLAEWLANGYVTVAFRELLHAIPESDLWSLDDDALAARWSALEWRQRDPAHFTGETLQQRTDREIRALVATSVYAANPKRPSPCGMRAPAGLDAFRASIDEAFDGELEHPDAPVGPLQAVNSARVLSIRLVETACGGDAAGAAEYADQLRCLERAASGTLSMVHGLVALQVRARADRAIEAALPWVEWDERRDLVARAATAAPIEPAAWCARLLRAERAHVHAVYARAFAEHGGDGLGVVGALFPGRPMHGVFLDALEDFDAALAIHEEGEDYAAASVRLDALRDELDLSELDRALSPAVIASSGPLQAATRAEAMRRMWLVALALLDDGTDAAAERAASWADPFGDGPLRTRVREDGVFEIWSVGPDGVDDGGATAATPDDDDPDLVLRIPRDPPPAEDE